MELTEEHIEALVEIANHAYTIHKMALEGNDPKLIRPVVGRQIEALERAGYDIKALESIGKRREAEQN